MFGCSFLLVVPVIISTGSFLLFLVVRCVMRRLRSLCRRMGRGGLGFYAVVGFRRPRCYRIYRSDFRDMRFSSLVYVADTLAECELFLLDQC